MAQILASNICNYPRAAILVLREDDHAWSKNETMQAWIESGGTSENWPRRFSLVIVTDKTASELKFLLDQKLVTNADGELEGLGNRYHFSEPTPDNEIWQTLYNTGEYSAPWAVVAQYIVDRGSE